MNNTKQYFQDLRDACHNIYDISIGSEQNIEKISRSYTLLTDLKSWIKVLENRSEYKIFETAIKELESSIIALNFGFYSKSYTGLRFFLERSLVAILFSSQEIELKLWEKGERDTYWYEIIDDDKGIFSPRFSRAFFPELKDEIKHFQAMTKKVYRECSEYVHGNNSIIQCIPSSLEFSQITFESWHEKFGIIARIILFTLNLRYAKYLSNNMLKSLEDINLDHFNHIKPIQELFDL